MIILDSDVVTHLYYDNENVKKKIEQVKKATPAEVFAVTIVTWHEVMRGRIDNLLKASNEAELKAAMARVRVTEQLLADFSVVDVDDSTAANFERLRTHKKLKMRRGDMLIACIALANDALLVTRNTKDFDGVAGLKLDNWVD